MLGIGPLLMYAIMRYGSNIPTDDAVGAANPSLATYFKDIAGSAVVVEILFFYAHRALHFKSIYGECSDVHVLKGLSTSPPLLLLSTRDVFRLCGCRLRFPLASLDSQAAPRLQGAVWNRVGVRAPD